MKRFLAIALMMCVLVMVGCGNSNYSDETFLKPNASWVENKEYISDFLDAAETLDEDFFVQQLLEGKIKYVDKETQVAVINELEKGKILEIKFLQGRYKNKTGYTLAKFIRDIGNSTYDIGYLKQGAAWEDETGKAHYNAKQVKVEIWKQKIVTGGNSNLIQIYFLEGENTGQWGYVREISLSR